MTHTPSRRWYQPMRPRRTDEDHRVSTPLELLFDLCFVVAVSQAAARLHHAVGLGQLGHGLVGYGTVFFAIWWAWMNFTWFASAYDTDDVPYRLTTLVQIAGVLVLAASVPHAFDVGPTPGVIGGYVIMRLAMVSQWLRAARTDPAHRTTARRFAVGITATQVGWTLLLLLPASARLVFFVVLALAELAVPVWAERANHTTWHPHHIAERYGLFTLIVLGESVLAATTAIQGGLDAGAHTGRLVLVAASGVVVVFALWWLYFDQPAHQILAGNRDAFRWGYGHLLVFASAAAIGAGLQVAVDHAVGADHVTDLVAGAATAVPVAVFLLSVWWLHICPLQERRSPLVVVFPLVGVLVLGSAATPVSLPVTAVLLAALVAVTQARTRTPAGG